MVGITDGDFEGSCAKGGGFAGSWACSVRVELKGVWAMRYVRTSCSDPEMALVYFPCGVNSSKSKCWNLVKIFVTWVKVSN